MSPEVNCGFPFPLGDMVMLSAEGSISYIETSCFESTDAVHVCAELAKAKFSIMRCVQEGFHEYALVILKTVDAVRVSFMIREQDFYSSCAINGMPQKSWQKRPSSSSFSASSTDSQLKQIMTDLIQSSRDFTRCASERSKYDQMLVKAKEVDNIYQARILADKLAKAYVKKSLQEEIEASELKPEDIAAMKKSAKGLYTIKSLCRKLREESGAFIVLGLRTRNISNGLSKAFDFEDWGDAYFRMYHTPFENPEFISDVVNEGKSIIFLVPPRVFSHPEKGATARELRWLIDHPEAMSKAHFVFGAYEAYTKEEAIPPHTSIDSFTDEYQENLVCRLFLQFKAKNSLPADFPVPSDRDIQLLRFERSLQENRMSSSVHRGPTIEEVSSDDESPTVNTSYFVEEVD